jgi:putative RNA 2'-phosphotransferase
MDEKKRTKISKFLSLILRHQPEAVGLTLDENGWVAVDDLIRACASHGRAFTHAELEEVVQTNDKKRFAFDESGRLIRANQGHSVEVEIEFEERTPPAVFITGRRSATSGTFLKKACSK